MKTTGKGLALIDRLILMGCIPLGAWLLYFAISTAIADESELALRIILFLPISLLGGGIAIVGAISQFSYTIISEQEIRYRVFLCEKKIGLNEIREIIYPVSFMRGGFSQYTLLKTSEGEHHTFPCSGGTLRRAIIDLQVKHLNETRANQAEVSTPFASSLTP